MIIAPSGSQRGRIRLAEGATILARHVRLAAPPRFNPIGECQDRHTRRKYREDER
jgi:hypothetical protein